MLALKLLEGEFAEGDAVAVDAADGELTFDKRASSGLQPPPMGPLRSDPRAAGACCATQSPHLWVFGSAGEPTIETTWGSGTQPRTRAGRCAGAFARRRGTSRSGCCGAATDAARQAGERALSGSEPLQRLIQTKLAWPLADAWRDGGTAMRTSIATAAIAARRRDRYGRRRARVAERGSLGHAAGAGRQKPVDLAASPIQETLQGVPPDFAAGSKAAAGPAEGNPAAAAGKARAPIAVRSPARPPPGAEAFAGAFVRYEVGEVDESTAATFAAVCREAARRGARARPAAPAGGRRGTGGRGAERRPRRAGRQADDGQRLAPAPAGRERAAADPAGLPRGLAGGRGLG